MVRPAKAKKPIKMEKLTEKDFRILWELQKDCKKTLKQLSKITKIPITTIYDRVKRMEKEGLIKRYSAILNYKKLRLPITAFILVSTIKDEETNEDKVISEISRFLNVQEAHLVSGDWDLVLKMKAKSVDEIGDFVLNKLRKIRGISRTQTFVSLRIEKESISLPLSFLKV